LLYGRNIPLNGLDLRDKVLIYEEHVRGGFMDDVLEIIRSQPDVEGKEDGADLWDGVKGLKESMTIVAQVGYPVSLPAPHGEESIGETVDPLAELEIGEPAIAANDSRLLAVDFESALQKTHWC